jgi:hypothetical protein
MFEVDATAIHKEPLRCIYPFREKEFQSGVNTLNTILDIVDH